MFIDYLSLLIMNMAAGLMVLGCYVIGWPCPRQEKGWASVFLIVGTIAFIGGLHMTLTWPLPGSYNVAFGELTVIYGSLFLAAGVTIARNYNLLPVTLYAVVGGIIAIVVGARMINMGLTSSPIVAGAGFIITGLSGMLLLPLFYWNKTWLKIFFLIFLAGAVLIWLYLGCLAYWGHLQNFVQWKPLLMR